MARRLICPKCAAQYEIDASMIPAGGRDVECSSCGHVWHEPGAENTQEGPRLHRPLEASILSILRGEAEREIAARQAERDSKPTTPRPSQLRDEAPPKTGEADVTPPAPPVAEGPRPEIKAEVRAEAQAEVQAEVRTEAPPDAQPEQAPSQPAPELPTAAEPAPVPAASSKAEAPTPQAAPSEAPRASEPRHLPDAESLAATLIAPSSAVVRGLDTDAEPVPPSASGRGFRIALLLAAAFLGVYLAAPHLADQGRAGEMLAEWRLDVDRGRVWLYEQSRETMESLRAMLP